MRGRSITYIVAMLIALGIALYSGDRLYYVLFAMLCAPPVIGLAWVVAAFIAFSYAQTVEPERAVKGDTATLRLTLSNGMPIPVPMVRVDYRVPGLGGDQSRAEGMGLGARADETVLDAIPLRYRGVFPVGITRITAYDPFGLFRVSVKTARLSYHKPLELTVRPRVTPLDTPPVQLPTGEDMREDRLTGVEDTSSPSDTRAYVEGDPLKRVHWKLFARSRELSVKTFETLSQPDIRVFVDLTPTGLEGDGAVMLEDVLIECLASVIFKLLDMNALVRVIFYTPDRREVELRRMQDFEPLHTMLATLAFNSPFAMGDVLKYERAAMLPGRSAVVMFSCRIEDEAVDQMMLLSRQSTPVTFIYAHDKAIDEPSATVLERMNGKGVRALHCSPGDDVAARLS